MSFEEKMSKADMGAVEDGGIKEAIEKYVKNNEIPCAAAFEAARRLNVPPGKIGEYADRMRIKLIKCQLGLYGYSPNQKIVNPTTTVDGNVKAAVQKELINGRLPCKAAWEIAERLNLTKMTISSACETMGIKIKPCQLGAF